MMGGKNRHATVVMGWVLGTRRRIGPGARGSDRLLRPRPDTGDRGDYGVRKRRADLRALVRLDGRGVPARRLRLDGAGLPRRSCRLYGRELVPGPARCEAP